MLLVVLIIALVLVAVILYLPYLSGLTEIKKAPKKTQQHVPETKRNYNKPPINSGYLPSDEANLISQNATENVSLKAKASALKDSVKIPSYELPIKITLSDQQKLTHRRREKLDTDRNPNNYDYDIDELIAEEKERAAEEQKREFYAKEKMGQDKEAMV